MSRIDNQTFVKNVAFNFGEPRTMTDMLLTENHTFRSTNHSKVNHNQVLLEDFVVSPYNRIVISGNIVTRRRRPHRHGFITNYYLNGSRVSLDTLRAFFSKALPQLTHFQVELNQLCAAVRTEVTAERLSNRDKSDRSWSTEQIIDSDRVIKMVDVANGNKVTFKLNNRKISLTRLKEHFDYGEHYEEMHDFAQRSLTRSSPIEVEQNATMATQKAIPPSDSARLPHTEHHWAGLWKVVEYVAPYLVCVGIFVLMGKIVH